MVVLIDPLHISLNANEGVIVRHHAFFSAVWKGLFPKALPLAKKPQAWRTMFLLCIIDEAYMRIRDDLLRRFLPHASHEMRWLLILLEEEIPAALDVFSVLHKAGNVTEMLKVCTRLWTTFAHQKRTKYQCNMLHYIYAHLLSSPTSRVLSESMPVRIIPYSATR